MHDQIERFLKGLTEVLSRCVVEDFEILEPAVLILLCVAIVFFVCCFRVVIHDFIFDPASADLATRLTQLSINPDKWKFLS